MAGELPIGTAGVWWGGAWPADANELSTVLGRLKATGYRAVWSPGGFGDELSPHYERLLAADPDLVVASGIQSIWVSTPESMAAAVAQLRSRYGPRFLLGLGVSHAPLVEPGGQRYNRPYERMVGYLDELDRLDVGVPSHRRVLAALGPRMLRLASERAAGAHPYLVTVEHTEGARAILGPGPLLAPEVPAVIETRPERARAIARQHLELYLTLPNYTGNLERLGFTPEDFVRGGSDRLVDALVAWGDEAKVADRVRAHLAAGASHVCVQMLGEGGRQSLPIEDYERLAQALSLSSSQR